MSISSLYSNTRLLFLSLMILGSSLLQAQIDDETATTLGKPTVEVKNIEKKNESAVLPKISSTPVNVNYSIIDIAPSSDFETSDLPPSPLNNLPKLKRYENYIEGGYGNLSHLWIDGYGQYKMSESQKIGLRLNHNSTNGLKDFQYNSSTNFSKTKGEVFFESALKGGQFHSDFNFTQNRYHLYGSSFPTINFPDSIGNASEQKLIQLGGKASYKTFESKFFNRASFKAQYLSDHFDSRELDLGMRATLDKTGYIATIINNDFDLGGEIPLFIGFTNSSFKQGLNQEFGYFHAGVSPVAKLIGDELDFKLGASVEFLSESQQGENDFYFFPQAQIEYKGLEIFKVFVGVEGGLELNSYQSMLEENRYLFPDQTLAPTENKYNVYAGIKGDFNRFFNYEIKGSYGHSENILMYAKKNDSIALGTNAFDRFNTFEAAYDNGKIINVTGTLNYLQIENLNLGLQVSYMGYTLENFDKVLNRPNLRAQIKGSYQMLNDKLTLGTQLFFVGNRTTNDFRMNDLMQIEAYNRTLDSYFDANFTADYQLKPYLNLFIKGINVFNAENEIFAHYPIQGIQFLGGVLFKF